MEDKTEYVKAQLKAHRGEWSDIARKARVGRRTIGYLMNSKRTTTLLTIDKLYKHLKKLERKA